MIENLRKLQRPIVAIGLILVVIVLAIRGEAWAQEVVKGTVGLVIGFLFGERAARNGGK